MGLSGGELNIGWIQVRGNKTSTNNRSTKPGGDGTASAHLPSTVATMGDLNNSFDFLFKVRVLGCAQDRRGEKTNWSILKDRFDW